MPSSLFDNVIIVLPFSVSLQRENPEIFWHETSFSSKVFSNMSDGSTNISQWYASNERISENVPKLWSKTSMQFVRNFHGINSYMLLHSAQCLFLKTVPFVKSDTHIKSLKRVRVFASQRTCSALKSFVRQESMILYNLNSIPLLGEINCFGFTIAEVQVPRCLKTVSSLTPCPPFKASVQHVPDPRHSLPQKQRLQHGLYMCRINTSEAFWWQKSRRQSCEVRSCIESLKPVGW